MKRQTAIVTGISAVMLLAFHLLATVYDWYTTRLFFDKYMHFLGGVFVFFTLAMYFLRHIPLPFTGRQMLVLVLFVFVIGGIWELFELVVQLLTGAMMVTPFDSFGDLVFDVFGALAAACLLFLTAGFVQMRKKRYTEETK